VNKQCLDAWKCLAVDPATSACLSVEQALPLATAIQNNSSVVPILNNWFSSLCCQPACSTKTITAVHDLLLKKCSGLDDWTIFDPRIYPTWRKDVCLKKFDFLSLLSWIVPDAYIVQMAPSVLLNS